MSQHELPETVNVRNWLFKPKTFGARLFWFRRSSCVKCGLTHPEDMCHVG